jgi:hypothetical protein
VYGLMGGLALAVEMAGDEGFLVVDGVGGHELVFDLEALARRSHSPDDDPQRTAVVSYGWLSLKERQNALT